MWASCIKGLKAKWNKPLRAARLNGSDLCRNVLNPSADSLCCRTSSHSLGWLIHGPLSGRELHTSKSFDPLDVWEWACNPISIESPPARGTSSFQRSCSQDGGGRDKRMLPQSGHRSVSGLRKLYTKGESKRLPKLIIYNRRREKKGWTELSKK